MSRIEGRKRLNYVYSHSLGQIVGKSIMQLYLTSQ